MGIGFGKWAAKKVAETITKVKPGTKFKGVFLKPFLAFNVFFNLSPNPNNPIIFFLRL